MSKTFYRALGKTELWPDISLLHPASLTYDDVILVPQSSHIKSRQHIDTSVEFGPFHLTKPIIAAPMDTISGEKMVRELARLGALGTLPRGELSVRLQLCKDFTHDNIPCLYAIGLKNGMEEACLLHENGAQAILLDVAHGGMETVKELAVKIKKELGMFVAVGNIVSYTEALKYKEIGIDVARVGVGPGGLCKTRIVAGSGFPQLSAIFETTTAGIPIIADGGIKLPADFAKAMAAGATCVMIGSLFAGTDESPGDVLNGKKVVRGQASSEYMKDNGVSTGEFRTAEGVSIEVPTKGRVEFVIHNLMGGLRSAMAYAGAASIVEFHKKALFCPVSLFAQREGIPWLSSTQ